MKCFALPQSSLPVDMSVSVRASVGLQVEDLRVALPVEVGALAVRSRCLHLERGDGAARCGEREFEGNGCIGSAMTVVRSSSPLAARIRVTGRVPHSGACTNPRTVVIGDSGRVLVKVKTLRSVLHPPPGASRVRFPWAGWSPDRR